MTVHLKGHAEHNSRGLGPRIRLTGAPWLFGLIFLGVFLAASEGGLWLGQRSQLTAGQITRAQIIAVEEAVLAILALLLAFSLVMAVSRFDSRRLLTVAEANAIGTTYWLCRLVPAPEGLELLDLLKKYLDEKVHFFDSGVDVERLRASRERTTQLQKEMWTRAAVHAKNDPRSIPAGLLLESLNHIFDLENSRWMAFTVRLPVGVLGVDFLVALLAGLLVGYNFGLDGYRDRISAWVLVTCVAAVLGVILDLNHPSRGVIQVDVRPLIDLQRHLEETQ